jgi:hypothetical protein
LVTLPSVTPFDQGSANAAQTAARSSTMPRPKDASMLSLISTTHQEADIGVLASEALAAIGAAGIDNGRPRLLQGFRHGGATPYLEEAALKVELRLLPPKALDDPEPLFQMVVASVVL